jgi:hypothetical protein
METEQLVKLLLTVGRVELVTTADARPQLSKHGGPAPPALLPRDAQRRLCVWLI